jgi:hypothetical protein
MTTQPNNPHAIENLIVGHFDGALNDEQEKELAEALATSAAAKQLFLSYMRMEERLYSLGRDGLLGDSAAELAGEPGQTASQPVDIAAGVPSGRRHPRLFSKSTSLTVCAVVILTLSFWGLRPPSVSASSVLREAQQAATELIDRTYRVVLSDASGRSQTRKFTINVRGEGRFVVRPIDGAYVMGSDGTNYWLIRKNGPVWVTSDFRSLAPKLQRKIPNRHLLELAASPNEPLLLEMAALLSLIERKYDLEFVPSVSSSEHHVRATLRSEKYNGPTLINFWADADSGVVLRVEIEWSNDRKKRFELVESETLSERWYDYSAHAPGRTVKRLDASKSE